MSIVPNAHETEIFSILAEAALALSDKGSKGDVVVRVAGGWVRDKLLRLESDDIDVALENCSGMEFANQVNATLSRLGYEEHRIGLIQANPEQSKHLETANVRVLGTFIDCVNLRSEVYADNSRIPAITHGTPSEDALRRDFTINSLFYNIHTNEVEDYSSKGVEDLMKGRIRTPLSAFITFKDDPLRVLRAVRFASRYNFSLSDDLTIAASSPLIRQSLVEKISRERILHELDGMLAGTRCRPPAALWTLFALDLFDSVFNPSHSDTDCVAPKNWEIHSSLVISVSNALLRLPYFTPLGYLQLEVGDDRDLPENIATSEIYVQPESPLEIPYSILYGHQEHLIGDQVDYENILMSQRLIYLASAVSGKIILFSSLLVFS